MGLMIQEENDPGIQVVRANSNKQINDTIY